jgi:hypothetical protein
VYLQRFGGGAVSHREGPGTRASRKVACNRLHSGSISIANIRAYILNLLLQSFAIASVLGNNWDIINAPPAIAIPL